MFKYLKLDRRKIIFVILFAVVSYLSFPLFGMAVISFAFPSIISFPVFLLMREIAEEYFNLCRNFDWSCIIFSLPFVLLHQYLVACLVFSVYDKLRYKKEPQGSWLMIVSLPIIIAVFSLFIGILL